MKFIPQIHSSDRKIILILFIIGLLVRTVFAVWTYSSYGTAGWSDDREYIFIGQQFAEGNWDPITNDNIPFLRVAPFIPAVVAVMVLLFGDPVFPMFIYHILIGALLVPVLYLLGKKVFNRKVGLLMAVWGCFFFESLKYTPHVLKEPTLFLIIPLTLLLLVKAIQDKQKLKYIILSALSYIILIHTDERFVLYLPLLGLLFFLDFPKELKVRLKYYVIWTSLVLLMMVPWTIRNYYVFDQLVVLAPRTTTFTSIVWGDDVSKLYFTDDSLTQTRMQIRYERAPELEAEFGKKPIQYGKYEAKVRDFWNFWRPSYFQFTYISDGFRPQQWSLRHNLLSMAFYGIFLPFYIAGIFMLYRRKLFIPLFIAAIPFIHSLVHAYMTWAIERYRSPVTFIVVMIGIWAALEIYEWFRKRFLQKQKTV